MESLLAKMDLTRYADKPAGTYSGGNKPNLHAYSARLTRLSSRRTFDGDGPRGAAVHVGRHLGVHQGRTVVLTSHSMEECEALCNRIASWWAVDFVPRPCSNQIQRGLLRGPAISTRRGRARVRRHLLQESRGLEVVEARDRAQASRRRSDHRTLAHLRGCESLRTEPAPPLAAVVSVDDRDDGVPAPSASGGLVDDYSVSQTTLEQVFVRFAAKQTEETGAAPGLGGRFGGATAAMDDDAPPPKRKGAARAAAAAARTIDDA